MKNPWLEISLNDYENHMRHESIMQLQAMSTMMKRQFYQYPTNIIMILGIAGGNGLEHIETGRTQKIYGIDINSNYLKECVARYRSLNNILECICVDLTNDKIILPFADIIIANLLVEYIGYECFKNIIVKVMPKYVSCVIQINTEDSFVSSSPFLQVFDDLHKMHHQINSNDLRKSMNEIGYDLIDTFECILPNNKKLVQLDFKHLSNSEDKFKYSQ